MNPVAAMAWMVILMQTANGLEPSKRALELTRLDTLIELAEARRDRSRIEASLAKLGEGRFDAPSDKTLEHLQRQLNAAEKTLKDLRSKPQGPSDETKKAIASTEARVTALSGKVKLAQTSLREYFQSELLDARGNEKRLKDKLKEIQEELDRPPPTAAVVTPTPAMVVQPPVVVPPPAPARAPEMLSLRVNPKDSLQYAWIPPGSFKMGCAPNDRHCEKDEYPQHEVTIKRGFWIANTEVTVNAYVFRFKRQPPKTETNPRWKYTDLPVTKVTWRDAQDYCEWAGGRLPTEAEWEYAARGGARDSQIYPWGDEFDSNRCNSFRYRALRKVYPEATPVRIFEATGWNLFDMIGNVREWVLDVYTPDGYSGKEPPADPSAAAPGKDRVVRGGSFNDAEKQLRTSARFHRPPEKFDNETGFRCVIPEGQIAAK